MAAPSSKHRSTGYPGELHASISTTTSDQHHWHDRLCDRGLPLFHPCQSDVYCVRGPWEGPIGPVPPGPTLSDDTHMPMRRSARSNRAPSSTEPHRAHQIPRYTRTPISANWFKEQSRRYGSAPYPEKEDAVGLFVEEKLTQRPSRRRSRGPMKHLRGRPRRRSTGSGASRHGLTSSVDRHLTA